MPEAPPEVVARLRAAGCVFAEDEALLLAGAAATPAELETLLARRVGGLPLEQVLGWAEFCGLRIAVEPGVFVPRRRSELLVREAAGLLRLAAVEAGPPVVVDLCCGSGAVGAALAAVSAGAGPVEVGPVELHAVDIDPVAVRCARSNLAAARGQVYAGDLYDPLPAGLRGRVAVLLANAPYVPTAAIALMPPEARSHEPRVALDGGVDGLDIQRRVAAGALPWLTRGGHLLIETSERQAPLTLRAMADAGLQPRQLRSEELDATVAVGTRR